MPYVRKLARVQHARVVFAIQEQLFRKGENTRVRGDIN